MFTRIGAALARSAKAIAAGVVAAGAVLDKAQDVSTDGGSDIVAVEWRSAAIAGVVAFAAIYMIPNRPKDPPADA